VTDTDTDTGSEFDVEWPSPYPGVPAFDPDADEFAVEPPGGGKPWREHVVRQAMPFSVAALLWAAAESAYLAPDTWPVGAPVAASVYFVAAIGMWTAWARNNPVNRKQRRRWAYTVIGAGGGWLLWAASFGAGHVATMLLAVGGGALMLPYWARHALWTNPRRPAPPAPEPDDSDAQGDEAVVPETPTVEVAEPELDTNQLLWQQMVGGRDGLLPGSVLLEPKCSEVFDEYLAQLDSRKHTSESAFSVRRRIAALWGMPLTSVSVLPHPMGFEDKVLVRFSRTNPLQAAKPYPGPQQAIDLTGGNIRVLVGFRADGSPVWWTLFEAGWGMRGGAVFGDTGSGKSVLLRSLITSFAYTGLVLPVVGCPQGGASYPMWIKHAPWPAPSGDEIMHQARGLLAAHRRRSAINRLQHRDLHIPTRDAPLLPWFVDELHKMREHPAQDEFFAIADIVEREGRKTGIRMVIADQDPSVPKTFNNLNSLRSSLIGTGGQCVILRISKNVGAQLPGGLVDPRTIPTKFPDGTPTSGLAVLNGEPELFRVANLIGAEELAAAAPTLEPEPAIVGIMGDHYGKRHTRRAEEDGKLAVEIAKDDPELYAQLVRDDPTLAVAAQAAAEAARRAAHAKQDDSAASEDPTTDSRAVLPRVSVPQVPAIKPITWTCEQRVLQAVRHGFTKFGDIKAEATKPDRTQYSETALRDAIASLGKRGLVDASQWGQVLLVDPSEPAEGKRTA
jgi:hypothetical protein